MSNLFRPIERQDLAEPIDVVVVGAGLAGLIASCRLADAGHAVALVERGQVGGRARTAERDGYRLNQGPHALYVGGALDLSLRSLGVRPAGVKAGGSNSYGSLAGRFSALPTGAISLLRSKLVSGRAKRQLPLVMDKIGKVDPEELATTSVAEWLVALTDAPDLQQLLRALIRLSTYSADVEQSADAAANQLQLATGNGVQYLHGGWQQLVDGLRERAVSLGVAMVDGVVDGISAGPRPVVKLGCQEIEAKAVILAAGRPAVADQLLDTERRLRHSAGPPVEASVLEIGLDRTPARPVLLGIDEPHYFSVHSIADRLAPVGKTLAIAARYLHPGEDAAAGSIRRGLEDHAELAGVGRGSIEFERFSLRLTVAGGSPQAKLGGLGGRPKVTVADRPGIFLAGDWVGDSGLLADAAAASAGKAAKLAIQYMAAAPAPTGTEQEAGTRSDSWVRGS